MKGGDKVKCTCDSSGTCYLHGNSQQVKSGVRVGQGEEIMSNEINRRITEEIFGECWHDEGSFVTCSKCGINKTNLNWTQRSNPNYCESISGAWKVVEKMKELGYIKFHFHKIVDTIWCGFSKEIEKMEVYTQYLEKDAVAICLSALKVTEKGEQCLTNRKGECDDKAVKL